MFVKFSKKISAKPRKQRKAVYDAPLHERRKRLRAHLSRELRASLGRRSVLPAKGDGVKVIRGKFRGAGGKIVNVDVKHGLVSVEGLAVKKQSGKERVAELTPNKFIVTDVGQRKIRPGGKLKKAVVAEKKVVPLAAVQQV